MGKGVERLRGPSAIEHRFGHAIPCWWQRGDNGERTAIVCDRLVQMAVEELGPAGHEPKGRIDGIERDGALREDDRRIELSAVSKNRRIGKDAAGTQGIAAICTLRLPKAVRDVIVLADGDDAGEAAARKCALRWKLDGRRVRIARPPKGMDFNDMLLGRLSSIVEGAQ